MFINVHFGNEGLFDRKDIDQYRNNHWGANENHVVFSFDEITRLLKYLKIISLFEHLESYNEVWPKSIGFSANIYKIAKN